MAIQSRTVEVKYCDVCKETFGNIHYDTSPWLEKQAKEHVNCYRCGVQYIDGCSRRNQNKHTCFDLWCAAWYDVFYDINEAIEKGITNEEVWEKWKSECDCND